MSLKKISQSIFAAVLAAMTTALFAQWAVDMGAAVRVQPYGGVTSVRYGYVNRPALSAYSMSSRPLPSESRYMTFSSGLLPSENRMLRQQAGLLPSQGRAAYLMPLYDPIYSTYNTQNLSVRYGNPAGGLTGYAYAAPALSRLTPTLAYTTVKATPYSLSTINAPTWSVRYGRTNSTLSPAISSIGQKPFAAGSVPYSTPGTGFSAGSQSTSLFQSGTFSSSQSIRYGQTGTGFVTR
jgi:hypothetical protein